MIPIYLRVPGAPLGPPAKYSTAFCTLWEGAGCETGGAYCGVKLLNGNRVQGGMTITSKPIDCVSNTCTFSAAGKSEDISAVKMSGHYTRGKPTAHDSPIYWGGRAEKL